MKRIESMLIIVLILLVALGACRSTIDDSPTPLPNGGGEATATAPQTATDAYPSLPTPTPSGADYPAPAIPPTVAPPTAYPADMELWMLRPMGQQCVDAETYAYEDVDEAVEALEEAGVDVLAAEEMSRPVCAGCDCPTSEHFRVQIRAQDLVVAEDLGWFQE